MKILNKIKVHYFLGYLTILFFLDFFSLKDLISISSNWFSKSIIPFSSHNKISLIVSLLKLLSDVNKFKYLLEFLISSISKLQSFEIWLDFELSEL